MIYIPILIIVAYAVAVVITKISIRRWLLPWVWAGGVFKSLFGLHNRAHGDYAGGDTQWMTLSDGMVSEAVEYASAMMIQEGVVYPEQYIKRCFDCENFAQTLKHYFDLYIAREYGKEGYGIPTSVIGYTLDRGEGHSVLQVVVGKDIRWWDVYPKRMNEIKLSLREIGTIVPVVKG